MGMFIYTHMNQSPRVEGQDQTMNMFIMYV